MSLKDQLLARLSSTAADIPEGLRGKSVAQLRAIAQKAVRVHGLPAEWGKDLGSDSDDLISYIDQLCNEFHLSVGADGNLVKSESAATEADPELVQKISRRLYGQTNLWYVRAGNKLRLFVVTAADHSGIAEIRTVTMVFGSLDGVKWKDDSQGGWIITKGGDPVFSLESQLEQYVPGLHLHELTRL